MYYVEFQQYCTRLNIESIPGSSYHSQTNGMVERVNQEFKRILKKLCLDDLSIWDRYAPLVTFNLNVRSHTVTGFSPFYLTYGFEPKLPRDLTSLR